MRTYMKLLGTLILVLGMSGCQSQPHIVASETQNTQEPENTVSESEDTITLTFFDKNIDGAEFDDDVAQVIMEKTGVRIEIVDATAEPEERIQMMLANRSYPDMILMPQGELVNRYIEAGALIPLDDLIDSYGQNIQEMYGDILNRSR